MENILENIIVFGAIGVAFVYLAVRWVGKRGGSCGCGCDCPASKDSEVCGNGSDVCIKDLRQK